MDTWLVYTFAACLAGVLVLLTALLRPRAERELDKFNFDTAKDAEAKRFFGRGI
jgi:hypothetical protein